MEKTGECACGVSEHSESRSCLANSNKNLCSPFERLTLDMPLTTSCSPVRSQAIVKGMSLNQKHLPTPALLDSWLRGKALNASMEATRAEERLKLAAL